MFLHKLLLTISCFSFSAQQNMDQLITLTKDFINMQSDPIRIESFLTCWDNKWKTKMTQTLSREYYFHKASNIVTKPNVDKNYNFHLIDMNCPKALSILEQAEKHKMFQAPHRWLIFGPFPNRKNFSFGIDSKIFIVNKGANDDIYEIMAMYKYSVNEEKVVSNEIALWSPENGITHYNELCPSRNRSNLMGAPINISYVVTNLDTLHHLTDSRHKQIDSITKVNYVFMLHLMDFMNSTGVYKMVRTWGYRNATTGVYSGMVGDLQLGESEVGGTGLFFTVDRVDIVDYIAATTNTYMKFIFRAPPLSYVTNVYTLPFEASVWHYCFVMIAVICAIIYVIVVWEWREPRFREKIEHNPEAMRPDIVEVFLLSVGAISQQGYYLEPKSTSGRIATIFTFLVLMFLYTAFSANIVALLQSTTDSIRTLDDLLKYRIDLGVEDIVYAHYYFKTAQEPTRKAIYDQKIAPKGQKAHFMSVEEGIRRVRDEFFGFHVELSTGYKVVSDIFQENQKCSLMEIAYVNYFEPSLCIRKNTAYKELIKVAMRKMAESGIKNREVNRIYTRRPICHTRENNFGSVGMVDCYSAFLFFGVGILISIGLLVFEIIFVRRKLNNLVSNSTEVRAKLSLVNSASSRY